MPRRYNTVLVGDAGVGKSTLLQQMKCGRFEKNYCSSHGAEVHAMKFDDVDVDVWDVTGNDRMTGDRKSYYAIADNAIIMYDVTRKSSYVNVNKWIKDLRIANPEIPIAVVGNKCDAYGRKIIENTYDMPHYEISVKNKQNLDAPFQWIAHHT
jgi:small GTP-binding protein